MAKKKGVQPVPESVGEPSTNAGKGLGESKGKTAGKGLGKAGKGLGKVKGKTTGKAMGKVILKFKLKGAMTKAKMKSKV